MDSNSPVSPNSRHEIEPVWREWIREQLRIGCDMSDCVHKFRAMGYTDESILATLESLRPRGNAFEQGVMEPPLLRRAPANLRKVETDKLQLYTLEDFLTAKECAKIMGLSGHHLRPSTLTHYNGDDTFRTSDTADLCFLKSPVATGIDDKICRTLGIRAEYSDGIQAQRYDVGQQFKPHFDHIPTGSKTYQRFAGMRGNRTWTFMVYLNDGMQGGATRFTDIDYAVQPKTGMALLWNNLLADGTPNLNTAIAVNPCFGAQVHHHEMVPGERRRPAVPRMS